MMTPCSYFSFALKYEAKSNIIAAKNKTQNMLNHIPILSAIMQKRLLVKNRIDSAGLPVRKQVNQYKHAYKNKVAIKIMIFNY